MPRVAQAEIERIKREVNLAALVAGSGVELRAHGDNLIGLCPYHNDKNPSLVVTESTNLWNCLGACRQGGSVIDWVMKHERVSFRHAVEILKPELPSLAAGSLVASAPARRKPVMDMSADDQSLIAEVVSYYHSQIGEAWPYLQERQLDDEPMVSKFLLGYCNRALGYHLPIKQLKAGKEIRTRLIEIGLLRESGHEHFAGSLTIPIFDEAGNVAGIYGRKVRSDLRKGTPMHMYLKGKHRGVWNWQGLIDSEEVILCEALIDALTFYAAGFTNVTASYGVAGFTEDHLAAFQRYGTKRVLIAYDRDEAGNQAARELAAQLQAFGIACHRIEYPIGKDANDYARLLARA